MKILLIFVLITSSLSLTSNDPNYSESCNLNDQSTFELNDQCSFSRTIEYKPQIINCKSPLNTDIERRGCCSWHNGVCGCLNGRARCCDGILSPTCGCD